MMLKEFETIRTTVTIPADLIKRAQAFVDSGAVPSRNAMIVTALEQFLTALERAEIDRQFEAMADDADYLTLNEQLADAFADSDWESWTAAESA